MSNELIKERIVLNQNIGRETTQILLEGDIIVPDVKPDIAVLLKTDGDVFFDKTDVLTDRINFFGKLNVRILYLAKGNDKAIHSIAMSAPIEDFIHMDGVLPEMWVGLNVCIANIEYRVLNDRKISYRAVVEIGVCAESKCEYDVVTGIYDMPETQLKKGMLNVNRTVENRDDRFIVKDDLSVPPGKPNIKEILQTNITIMNKEVKVAAGRVSISGELLVSTLYKGDDDESIIEFMEHEVPFNGAIDASGAKDTMFADAQLKVSDQYIQARPNEDGEDRIVEIEISVGASVKVTSQSEVEILEDAYCINKNLALKKEHINYPKLICRNKNQYPVKEIVTLEADLPDMLQIFRVSGTVVIDQTSVIEDKVIVDGVIHTDILYIASNDDAPLYNYKTVIPYKQIVETKGAMPHMEVSVETCIDHVGFNMLSEKEVELRYLLSFNTKVTDNKQDSIISDIEFIDIDKCVLDKMASMVIYVVQPGDTLWNIAKKYNASVEDLVSVNDIEDPNKIYPGQKLLVIKRVN